MTIMEQQQKTLLFSINSMESRLTVNTEINVNFYSAYSAYMNLNIIIRCVLKWVPIESVLIMSSA